MPPASPPHPGVKPTSQARSRATRDKIVAAFEQLLRTKSFENISVAELAQHAGVSVGAVYRRFENKDSLIPVIFELYQDRLMEWVASEGRIEAADDATLRDVLRIIVNKEIGRASCRERV